MTVGSKIRAARRTSGLTKQAIADAVGRSREWLGDIERDSIPLSTENEQRVLIAIKRLARFKVSVNAALIRLTADLKIPRLSPTGKARPSLPAA